MNKEEIIEGNRLIAEFMGGIYKISQRTGEVDKHRIYLGEDEVMYFVTDPDPERTFMPALYELRYHASYNWLFEVVEKMRQIKSLQYLEIYLFGKVKVKLKYGVNWREYESEDDDLLQTLYKSVIDFIKWYNTQNNPS